MKHHSSIEDGERRDSFLDMPSKTSTLFPQSEIDVLGDIVENLSDEFAKHSNSKES